MTGVQSKSLQWFAVRLKARQNGGRRTSVLNAEFETYTGRDGKPQRHRVKDTGRREFVLAMILKRVGFEVFLPVKQVWHVKNRFTKQKHLMDVPLLVDWMFVGCHAFGPHLHDLMALDVVAGVMGTGGRPVRLSHAKVMKLMRRGEGRNLPPEYHRYMRTGMEFEPGDDVIVLDGPFIDFPAKVVEMSGPSARFLVQIFGKDTEFEIAARSLGAG